MNRRLVLGGRLPVSLVVLVALVMVTAGCSSEEPSPRTSGQSEAHARVPKPVATDPVPMATRERVDRFMKRAELVDRVGAGFELRDVQYTSPMDAVAWFDGRGSGDTVISTTDDNWTHASHLLIRYDVAESVSYVPLGRGAVAIKPGDQYSRRSAPPFVLYADGDVTPLHVGQPRTPAAASDLLDIDTYDFFWAIDAPVRYLAPDDSIMLETLWGADVEAGEIFPLIGAPPGDLHEAVPGRDGAAMSVDGYRGVDEVWRFSTSTDGGHTWRQTDVRLPLGRQRLLPDASASTYAVGPASRHALAVTDYGIDTPRHLEQLWWTDDERQFRRAPLPRDLMPFAGMAFASDGALLLAEVDDVECSVSPGPLCTRGGRIWRLSPDGDDLELLKGGPGLFGSHGSDLLDADGGVIVAQSGHRTLSVSVDGYTWSEVTLGR